MTYTIYQVIYGCPVDLELASKRNPEHAEEIMDLVEGDTITSLYTAGGPECLYIGEDLDSFDVYNVQLSKLKTIPTKKQILATEHAVKAFPDHLKKYLGKLETWFMVHNS